MVLDRWCLAVAAILIALPGLARGADSPIPAKAASDPDWIVTIGIEARAVPAWAGASDNRLALTGLPLFGVRKAGTPPEFVGARDGIGFAVFDNGQLRVGPSFKLVWERLASSYQALNGLGNVDFALQAGGFAEYWPAQWLRLRGEARQGIGGETGLTGDLFVDAVVPLGQFRLSGGPRMTMQTAAAVSPYFSINATQSANSGVSGLAQLPVYNASGGIYSYGAGGQLEYFFNKQWATHGLVEFERLTGSVADSPLVTQRGSPNQLTLGLGATYSFAMHPLW
jgi:outer membrane protein